MKPSSPPHFERQVRLGWGVALVVLIVLAMRHIGAFDLTNTLENGRVVPNMFGTVDHPFHASRGATLLQSLRDGEILRWVGSHQGGYPAEFYPLGVAWLDVAVWAAFLGSVPILAIHKLTVALILVLPALAYWLLVRGDRMHPSIAFLATAFHLAVPGYWLNGGYEELVGWGLVTNVAGATMAVISTVLLARYILNREHWCGVLAVLSIAAGTVSNPRSLFGIVFATLAVAGWAFFTASSGSFRTRLQQVVLPLGIVAGLAFMISAPVIMALLRYNQHYFFLHYQFYDPISMFWDALELALSRTVLLIAIGGGILVFVARFAGRLRVAQVLAITTLLYTAFTVWVAKTPNPPPLVEQLEAPRLMPYQRLLMLALAAVFIVLALQWLTNRIAPLWREAIIAVVVLTLGFGSVQSMSNRDDSIPLNENALYPVSTVGDQRFADLEDAVALANDLRPQGSAIFVVGNYQEWWHEQLWASGIEQGTYYYDDWLWYWHRDQTGPYDASAGYYMPNPTDALNAQYFSEHGIGVVMVSDMWVPAGVPPKESAASNDLLEYQGSFGAWGIYTVKTPTPIATRGDSLPSSVDWSNQRIEITFDGGAEDVLVRQNWFPRWQAEVNGQSVPVTRSSTGYMVIDAPDGPIKLTLTYGVTGLDWTARVMSIGGLAGLAFFAARGNGLSRPDLEKGSNVATTA